jgi:hypothetical protein
MAEMIVEADFVEEAVMSLTVILQEFLCQLLCLRCDTWEVQQPRTDA